MASSIFDAAFKNDVTGIDAAVRAGVDPNVAHPRSGLTPLQIACQGNASDAVRALLALGASASLATTRQSRVDGRSFVDHAPLMYAQSVPVATALLDAGAEIEAANGEGWTALVCAANAYRYDVFCCLLDRGASPAVRFRFDGREMSLLEFIRDKKAFLVQHALGNPKTESHARESIAQSEKMEQRLIGVEQE